MPDPLNIYVKSRNALLEEKERLEQRLAQLSDAIQAPGKGKGKGKGKAKAKLSAGTRKVNTAGRKGAGKAAKKAKTAKGGYVRKNMKPLSDYIYEATKDRALTRQEILNEVVRLGYKFSSKNPLNSLGQTLYSSGKFEKSNHKFWPKKDATPAPAPPVPGPPPSSPQA